MKKLFPIVLLTALAMTGATCLADEQTRQIQSALSEAGFYFGTADGKMGEETRAALRRFQIRNGLDVSGEASPETLAALKIQKSEEPSTPSVAAEDEQQVASTAKKPDAFLAPQTRQARDEEPAEPVVPATMKRSPVRDFFADTDLADASADEQSQAVESAQIRLGRLGYYRSAPDGLPGPEMEEALLKFQHAVHLRLTGRLDSDTREALVSAPPSVPTKPFRSSQNRPPGVVLRGVWVH